MNINNITRIYFIGIGGIGMSAIARYFVMKGVVVSGYDKTPTELTNKLINEGMLIHYTDDIELLDKKAELVIYTPAIPKHHKEWNWYCDNNYPVYKRSDVLQWITEALFAITVAGTHGKTTISTIIAYLLRTTGYGCNAFLGGISVNFESNYWNSTNQVAVIEADEYDRSFLKLKPDIALLTAIDPDHLDIYGTSEEMEDAFIAYTHNVKPNGTLLLKYGLHREEDLKSDATITYSLRNINADVYAKNIVQEKGGFLFNVQGKGWELNRFHLNIGGLHNLENTVAALAAVQLLGLEENKLRDALKTFRGVKRRFEYIINTEEIVYIDDYAHHPEELSALINSAKEMFPNRKCVICFQPHLFTRTRDLADGFAKSLDMADEILLLDIYPARELPIEGITSQYILNKMHNLSSSIVSKEELLKYVKGNKLQLFITAGAGDVDNLIRPIKEIIEIKMNLVDKI